MLMSISSFLQLAHTAFPYTLQASPIAFTEEPESMSVLQGTTISLSCNTTILWNDNYRLPELIWHYNGQLLNDNHPSHFIRTHPNNSRSELTIMGVSQENSGYYECVARDGYHLLEGGEASYFYIKASQRAQLQVIGEFPILIVIRNFPSRTCFACMALKVSGGALL
jgi:hypothetical protein